MFEYIENLPVAEAELIKKTIQDLFRQTCILQLKYDPVTLVQRDNSRYQACVKHREFIADYFAVLGCELVHEPQENIFRITGDGVLTEHFNLLTTKLVLLLKIIYRDKIMGDGLNATVTTLAEIRRYGIETNLITKKLTAGETKESLGMLKRHQMIELPSAIGNLEDDSPIYIYNTINILCPTADINAIVNEYVKEMEEIQLEYNAQKEETNEEDIYQDVSE